METCYNNIVFFPMRSVHNKFSVSNLNKLKNYIFGVFKESRSKTHKIGSSWVSPTYWYNFIFIHVIFYNIQEIYHSFVYVNLRFTFQGLYFINIISMNLTIPWICRFCMKKGRVLILSCFLFIKTDWQMFSRNEKMMLCLRLSHWFSKSDFTEALSLILGKRK